MSEEAKDKTAKEEILADLKNKAKQMLEGQKMVGYNVDLVNLSSQDPLFKERFPAMLKV